MNMLLKTKLQFWLALVFLLAISFPAQSQTGFGKGNPGKQSVPINTGWQFREAGKDQWHAATVPGCVHTDLLANKLIDDPFYRDNEQKQQWIGKTDWEYQTHFAVTPEVFARKNIELVFAGLDTYADVYVNETLLLKADNMFRTWRVNVK